MKLFLITVAAFLAPTHVAAAPRRVVVQQDSALVVVPFAVPVATPVAVVNPTGVFCAYSPLAAMHGEYEEFRRWKESQAAKNAEQQARASSLVARTCLKCHSGAAAKTDFRLDEPMAADARLKAIREVLSGRMPKDKPLGPAEISALVAELAAE
jgi:hypothetical protein